MRSPGPSSRTILRAGVEQINAHLPMEADQPAPEGSRPTSRAPEASSAAPSLSQSEFPWPHVPSTSLRHAPQHTLILAKAALREPVGANPRTDPKANQVSRETIYSARCPTTSSRSSTTNPLPLEESSPPPAKLERFVPRDVPLGRLFDELNGHRSAPPRTRRDSKLWTTIERDPCPGDRDDRDRPAQILQEPAWSNALKFFTDARPWFRSARAGRPTATSAFRTSKDTASAIPGRTSTRPILRGVSARPLDGRNEPAKNGGNAAGSRSRGPSARAFLRVKLTPRTARPGPRGQRSRSVVAAPRLEASPNGAAEGSRPRWSWAPRTKWWPAPPNGRGGLPGPLRGPGRFVPITFRQLPAAPSTRPHPVSRTIRPFAGPCWSGGPRAPASRTSTPSVGPRAAREGLAPRR